MLVVAILLVEIMLPNQAHDQAWISESLDEYGFPSEWRLVHCRVGTDIAKASFLLKQVSLIITKSLLSSWDESKLSFSSLISLYDMGTIWDFLILFTFFSFVPISGKRISMLSICRDKGLAHEDLWRRECCTTLPYSLPVNISEVRGCGKNIVSFRV